MKYSGPLRNAPNYRYLVFLLSKNRRLQQNLHENHRQVEHFQVCFVGCTIQNPANMRSSPISHLPTRRRTSPSRNRQRARSCKNLGRITASKPRKSSKTSRQWKRLEVLVFALLQDVVKGRLQNQMDSILVGAWGTFPHISNCFKLASPHADIHISRAQGFECGAVKGWALRNSVTRQC